jgi:hypothetical protein
VVHKKSTPYPAPPTQRTHTSYKRRASFGWRVYLKEEVRVGGLSESKSGRNQCWSSEVVFGLKEEVRVGICLRSGAESGRSLGWSSEVAFGLYEEVRVLESVRVRVGARLNCLHLTLFQDGSNNVMVSVCGLVAFNDLRVLAHTFYIAHHTPQG